MDSFLNATAIHNCRLIIERKQASVFCVVCTLPGIREMEWAVLQRAGHICQGCLSAKAEVVHHLTYDHVGDELLYELVALCRACHDRAHNKQVKK